MDGASGVSWSDIYGWAVLTGIEMTSYEAKALSDMSAAYASEMMKSQGKQTIAPWSKVEFNRSEIADKAKSVFRSFKR